MEKKRIFSVMAAGAMMFGLAGCARPQDPPGKDPDGDDDPEQQEIEYVPPTVERYSNHLDLDGQWGATHDASGERGIGDPFVMRYNGKYYLYPSTSGPNYGIKVFESEDLVHWTYKGYAVAESEDSGYHAYAPEVLYYRGYFWMCQSRDGGGHYFYRSESPTEGFVRVSENRGMGIDGSFRLTDDGRVFLMHTTQPHGLVYNEILSLDDDITASDIGPTGTIGEADLYGRWIEGPGLFRRGDFSYLTYTGNEVLSKGYHLAYSYAENAEGFGGFIQPEDNVTFIDTGDEHAGLGHSSNVNGPDLDSVYTAYHSLVGVNESLRRYNVDRYFACGGILTPDGATHRPVALPAKPTAGGYADALKAEGDAYILGKTEDFFTAEFNFDPSVEGQYAFFGGDYRIYVENGKLYLSEGGEVLGKHDVNFPAGKLAAVRVENGDGVGHIYFDGMRLITYDARAAAGEMGYATDEGVGYTAFTNDVFGTSDFEALKNFPTKFPATSYLKGEMRGYSIANAKRVKGGVRVGEKESTVRIGDAYAVSLRKGDWVKYAVDVEKKATYSVVAEVSAESMGAKVKVSIGESEFTATIPDFATGRETVRVYLGDIEAAAGISAMKVECVSKKAEIVLFETYEKESGEVSLTDFKTLSGTAALEDGALVLSQANSAAMWKGSVTTDFEAELEFTCNTGDLGFMVRAAHYSFHLNQNAESWRGYCLRLDRSSLHKYSYEDLGELIAGVTPLADGAKHTVKITAVGNDITLLLDGQEELAVTDDYPFFGGGLGVFAHAGKIRVTALRFKAL